MDDLLIVGAGPCGLGCAIYARQQGLDVRVLERREGVQDKACGEGLMPGGVKLLQSLGVELPAYRPFRGIRYIDGSAQAEGLFSRGSGWGVRRTVLQAAMRERAEALGVKISHCHVQEVSQQGYTVRASEFEAPYLIAADGLNSTVRRQLGLAKVQKPPFRYGLRRHFEVSPWADFVEVYCIDDAEAYVTAVDESLVGVAILFGDQFRQRVQMTGSGRDGDRFYERALGCFSGLAQRCDKPASRIRGAGPFRTELSSQAVGRVLLAGDAAGYLDPLTGEGVRLGLVTGMAAVDAVLANSPGSYSASWRRLTRRYWLGTSGLLWLRRQPILRRLMVPFLRASPSLFGVILDQIDR